MHRLYIFKPRANNGVRTRDPQLGKLMLYQLSYIRVLRCKNTKKYHTAIRIGDFFQRKRFARDIALE